MRRAVHLLLLCFLLAAVAPAHQRGFAGRFGHGGVRVGGGFGHFGLRVGGGFRHTGFGHFRGFHGPGFSRPFFGSRIVVGPFGGSPFFRTRFAFGAFGYPAVSYGGFYTSAFPVFVGGGADYAVPSAPNVTIIYLPPPPATDQGPSEVRRREQPSARPRVDEVRPGGPEEPIRFLIPLRDGRVHVAAAYWVEGDTLHFIDSRGKHMSVALDQVDRELAEKLNRGMGVEFGLPEPKQAR